jgi:phosphoesterase RecJ-like protein
MASETQYEQAVALLEDANDVLITTHTKPDGDACGCIAVLSAIVRSRGKTARPLLLSAMPQWYAFLFDEPVPVLGQDLHVEDLKGRMWEQVDLVVIVDTNSYSQLPRFEDFLKQSDKPVLVVDHHVTSDHLGRVEITDSTAAATGLVLLDFLTYTGWQITRDAAEALFVAIATDTGWFQFNNTDSRAYRSCASLIDRGVNPTEVYDKLYQNFSVPRFRLMLTMLNRLELQLDDRYASQYILQKDFERTGAAHQDTENLINECHRIASVKVSSLFVELKDGRVRCSLRSRGAIDVSAIATKFGGGGHKMAAGTFLPGPVENARQLIFNEVAQRLE